MIMAFRCQLIHYLLKDQYLANMRDAQKNTKKEVHHLIFAFLVMDNESIVHKNLMTGTKLKKNIQQRIKVTCTVLSVACSGKVRQGKC